VKAPDESLARVIRSVAGDQEVSPSAIPGVACVRRPTTGLMENRRWRACLAVVAEGTKELVLGSVTYRLSPGHWTLTPVPLPVTSRIAGAPFGCVIVELTPSDLGRMVMAMDPRDAEPGGVAPGIFMGEVDPAMRDVIHRMSTLLGSCEAGRVLGTGCVSELLFHVLRGATGPAIRRYLRADGVAHRICEAALHIEAQLERPIDIEALCVAAHVSRTVFYEHFKHMTSLSPVQYQKRLRLLRAQHLMVHEHTTAEDAAFRVGYQSPSHFSRDYARLFGEPPHQNATRLREQGRSVEG
tara:strand:- start:3368 stop:4258 length:891 start_codon:yes stop_codon:yes gene_type:complete